MRYLLTTVLAVMLAQCTWGQNEYKMAGPYEIVARDGQYRNTKAGSERDMKAALDFAKEGKYDEAKNIIDKYAATLQRLDGHDAPLCLIQCYDMVYAMILSDPSINTKNPSPRPLDKGTRDAWEAMIRRAIVPTLTQFENDSPYANGNWGAIVNRCRIACAIFLKDDEMYEKARYYYLYADDNGTIANYVSESGQCQETGRDQGHAQLGLEAECQICEMAWLYKNDDLWGVLDNRLMKGIEYTAKYNLGYDVPFTTWTDCTGLYNDWTEPGQMGRGKLWEIYQLPYSHYHGRKGLAMPYTEQALKVLSDDKLRTKNEQLSKQKEHKVYTYDIPQGAPTKNDYDVYVQPRGSKEWTKIETYMAKVNAPISTSAGELSTSNGTGHKLSEISYTFFDFKGDVFVRVVCKNRKYKSVRIRPDYKGVIANVQNDSTVQFILFQPENVSVEFDGDISNNLLLFTNKPTLSKEQAQKEAKKQKRQFVYVPAGFYGEDRMPEIRKMIQDSPVEMASRTVDNTSSSAPATGHIIMIPSNTTIYLAPGCYIDGTLAIEDATNVSILGRGICRPDSGYEGVHVHRSSNVLVDGVTLCTCPIGESKNVTLHEVHSISHPGWGDGLNVFGGSSDILYDRVFCRNSDDCTTAYATRKGFKGSVNNVVMRNSTLWADVAHPIMIGIHGIGAEGNLTGTDNVDEWQRDSITNLRYENIDIICHSEPQIDYQGCIGINCGDNNVVKGVTFDNIRIEDISQGSLFHIKTVYNSKYCSAPGRSVEDVYFRNIRYGTTKNPAQRPYLSIITGYDEHHPVSNITFEGLRYNGQLIYDDMPDKPKWYKTSDVANMYVNAHVKNLRFKK